MWSVQDYSNSTCGGVLEHEDDRSIEVRVVEWRRSHEQSTSRRRVGGAHRIQSGAPSHRVGGGVVPGDGGRMFMQNTV